MLDRGSCFADARVVALLVARFVPVALDVWYEERRSDAAGELYRKIVRQRQGYRAGVTTQGFYVCSPEGALLAGWNNRDAEKVRRTLEGALAGYRPGAAPGSSPQEPDPRFARTPPEGGLVADVFSRVIEARWPASTSRWDAIFRASTGRDHLWLTGEEARELAAGRMPPALVRRIARFHLVDNTRGEPPMWAPGEVREARIVRVPERGRWRLEGRARLEAEGGERSGEVELLGYVEAREGKVTRFDLVARGRFQGRGRYTEVSAPVGPFTLAVAFRLAGKEEAAKVPPQGARDLAEYLAAR